MLGWGEERIDGRRDSAIEVLTATMLHIVVARAFDVHHACAVAAPLFPIRQYTWIDNGITRTDRQNMDAP